MASAQRLSSLRASKQAAWTATVATCGMVYFIVAISLLHGLRPDLNPLRHPTSEYAVGPYGYLMTSAFFSMSIASWALAIGLARSVAQQARSRPGIGFIALWGLGVLVAMIFPIDPQGTPLTVTGTVHRITGPLAFLSLSAGVYLVSRRFKADERWRRLQRPARILSLVMLGLFAGTVLSIATGSGFAGLFQRLYLATFATWFLLTASRLGAFAAGHGSS